VKTSRSASASGPSRQSIPVDGPFAKAPRINESAVTGESMPVGASLTTGLRGNAQRQRRTGRETKGFKTRSARSLSLVEQAQAQKSCEVMGRRFRRFTVAVLGIGAVGTRASSSAWWPCGPTRCFLLVAASPCALAVATP
jgi:cation transport ATPase